MINTTIPKVPSGLEPALNDFLNAVKKQIHIREGVNTKVKDDRFITFREANKLLDDRTQTLRKQIKKDTQFKRGDSDKIDLSPLKGELTNIKGRIEDIENSRVLDLQLKEGVFVNTFLHVGPDVPSDEGWNPEGVGITGAGIYGVGPEQEGHFFLGSYDISGDFGVMAPILGHEIWAGELRVGDDISYNSNTNLLNGSDWMWYRPGVGLSINIENGGGLTVGNYTTGTGIITGPEGLFVFDEGVMVHGFSTTDGIEVSLGNHTIDRNDAMMGKYFSGTGLYWDDSAETFSIKVSSNNRRIEIDDLGILGYSSGDNLVFGFTLKDLPDIPAGTGVFTGRIFATDIVGQPGEGVTVRSDVFTDTRLELDERGLVGYLNNELVFATFLDEVGDTPAGSLLARGHILLGKPDEGNGISFDAVNSQMQIYVGGSNRGIGIDEDGFWGYDENNDVKIGFTFVDLPDIPAGSAYFAGILFNTRIVGQPGEGVTVQPDITSHRRIEIDDLGLLGYNSNNDIAFGFTFEQIGDIPAGSAVFQGNIYGSEIIGTDGLTIRKEPGSTARLELDSNGLLGYNSSNELLFGFALQDVGDIPEGSGVFKGTVYAGSYINNTLAETVEHNAEVGATFTSTHAGAMAYENMVEEAKLGETIKEGGYIKTSLIDVDNLIVNNSIIVGGDSITNLTGRNASNISSVSGRRWAWETGADITSNHTAYNFEGAGTLDSGAVLTMKGDLYVIDGSILFYNGTTYRGGLWSSSSGVALVNNDISAGLWLRPSSGEIVVGGGYFDPNVDNTMSLGASNYRWSNFYSNHINCTTKMLYLGTSGNPFILRFRDPGTSTYSAQEAYIAPN